LTGISTAHPTEPLGTLSDPPIELPALDHLAGLHLDWRVDFPAIGCITLRQVGIAEIHI
jgi:hypothetical protein